MTGRAALVFGSDGIPQQLQPGDDLTGLVASLYFVIDGGGVAIATGPKADLFVPWNCTIIDWTLLADQSGSAVIDLWRATFANAPPTSSGTITGSAQPTLSSATKAQSSTLTGWSTALAAGDVIRPNVNSAATATRLTLALRVRKT